MKILKSILLIGTLLSTQLIATKTFAQEVKKDSVFPPQKDAIALAQSICGAGNFPQEKGKLSCKKCPSFTAYSGGGGTLTSVVYGSFTKAGSREALVDLGDCEAHSGNWGGKVLEVQLSERINQLTLLQNQREEEQSTLTTATNNLRIGNETLKQEISQLKESLNSLSTNTDSIPLTGELKKTRLELLYEQLNN